MLLTGRCFLGTWTCMSPGFQTAWWCSQMGHLAVQHFPGSPIRNRLHWSPFQQTLNNLKQKKLIWSLIWTNASNVEWFNCWQLVTRLIDLVYLSISYTIIENKHWTRELMVNGVKCKRWYDVRIYDGTVFITEVPINISINLLRQGKIDIYNL